MEYYRDFWRGMLNATIVLNENKVCLKTYNVFKQTLSVIHNISARQIAGHVKRQVTNFRFKHVVTRISLKLN